MAKLAIIRPYQEKDRDNVRQVLLHCASAAAQAGPGPARTAVITTYCDYYIDCEPHNCFVIANEHDEAVGYIMGCENYDAYQKRFMQEYVPRSKGLPFRHWFECRGAAVLPWFFRKQYPAHLHIDIHSDYQRMGLGHQLMDALTAHLRAKNVPGVMLAVAPDNTKGRNFYHKYGFEKLCRIPFTVVMGLKL